MTWDELKAIAQKSAEKEAPSRAEDVCVSKRSYQTQAEAMASLMRFKRVGKKHRGRHVTHWKRQMSYKCGICGQYHLTTI
jgi:hypothetical protein